MKFFHIYSTQYTMKKKQNNQQGYTIIELLIMIFIIGLLLTAISAVFLDTMRTKTRSSLSNQTRINGNVILENIIQDVKYSYGLNYDLSTPDIGAACDNNPCSINATPVCHFEALGLNASTTHDQVYYRDTETNELYADTHWASSGRKETLLISPSSLLVTEADFLVSPTLCLEDDEYSKPNRNDNIQVQVNLTLQSPKFGNSTSKAYTQAQVVLESSATMRTYQRLQ